MPRCQLRSSADLAAPSCSTGAGLPIALRVGVDARRPIIATVHGSQNTEHAWCLFSSGIYARIVSEVAPVASLYVKKKDLILGPWCTFSPVPAPMGTIGCCGVWSTHFVRCQSVWPLLPPRRYFFVGYTAIIFFDVSICPALLVPTASEIVPASSESVDVRALSSTSAVAGSFRLARCM